ncbi:hypothetical protein ScPMuIL_002872 [Solemya velum]
MPTSNIVIMIQPFNGSRTIPIKINPAQSMKDLYRKVSEDRGIEIQYLKFIYSGKEYRPEDDNTANKTIADIGIKDKSTVQLVTRQPGGRYLGYVDDLCSLS